MYDIILLGQIPGTNIRISFLAWLYIFSFLIIASLITWAYLQRHRLANTSFYQRSVLPASQLHSRLTLTAK